MIAEHLLIAALVDGLCGVAFGYNSAIVSGLKIQIIKYTYFDNLTDENLLSVYYGLYSASMLFGMVFGSSFGMWYADKFGRKKSLISCGIVLLITPLLCSFITNYWAIFVIRIILGAAVGLCSCVGPLYVTETVETKYRGSIGGMYQLLITFSMALGYLSNLVFGKNDYNENVPFERWQWSWQYGLGSIIGVMMLVLCYWVKETNVWLSQQKEKENNKNKNTTLEVKTSKMSIGKKIKWYVFGGVLGALAQLTGINSVMFYSNSILSKAGITNPYISTLCVVGLWNFVSTIIAMPFIKKFKRRTLYIWTYAGLTIGNLIMSLSYFLNVTSLSIVGIVVFLLMFELGPGCLFWIVASEAFPSEIRDGGMSFSVSMDNLANIAVTFCFPILEEAVGAKYCFILFMCICAFGTIFTYFCLPETSGDLDDKDKISKVTEEIVAIQKPTTTQVVLPVPTDNNKQNDSVIPTVA